MSEKAKTIAVDLDGTLARYDGWKGIHHIGEPFPGARAFMSGLCGRFHVIVYTTRTNYRINQRPPQAMPSLKPGDISPAPMSSRKWTKMLMAIVAGWMKAHNIPYHEIYDGNGKPMAAAFVDDRAVPCSGKPDQQEYNRMLNAATALALGVDNGLLKLQS